MDSDRTDLSSGGLRGELTAQKLANRLANFLLVGFQSEVSGVIEMDFRPRNIALKRFRAGRQEERIVLAPDRKQGWLLRAKILLELGIERHVAGIVQK